MTVLILRRGRYPGDMVASRFTRAFIALLGILALLALAAAPAAAETGADTLVVAKDIADLITLDPAEAFEFTAGEIIANLYDRIMTFAPEDPRALTGGVAESHTVSGDGKTITLRIRDGLRFHSGNPVRPEDVEFSLERVIRRDRSPASLLAQFGWNADNVGELIEAVDDRRVSLTLVEPFSPRLVLHVLSAGLGSVVDRKLALAQEQEGDLGAGWLRANSAGSGPFRLQRWEPGETVILTANPDYHGGAPGVRRVILRHVPEPAAQRRLLESGAVDLARDLTPDLIAGLAGNADVAVDSHPKGTVVYLAANAAHPILGKEQVVRALRHAVDYHGMADSFLAGQFTVQQAFLAARPVGGLAGGALPSRPGAGEVAAGAGRPRRRLRGAPRHAHHAAVSGDCAGGAGNAGRGRHRGAGGDAGWRGAVALVPRAPPRADSRPLVDRLRRPARQRRGLRAQPRQPPGSEPDRRAGLAQRLGARRDQRRGGSGAQPNRTRRGAPSSTAACSAACSTRVPT